MNKSIIAKDTTMGTTMHNHIENATSIAPFHSHFFESLHKEQWEEVKLGDIAEIKTDIWKVGGERENYIGLEHIVADSLRLCDIGNSNEVSSNKYMFKENDILFGKLRPYFRKIIKAKFKGICSTDIWVIRAKQDINQTFLFYFFTNKTLIDLSYSSSKGTRMPRADWNFLSQTTWLIPPLNVQQQIAEVLSSFDDKIDLLHRQNKTLESLALTLFRHTFIENPKNPNALCHSDLECNEREESLMADSKRDVSASPQHDKWKMGKLGDYVKIVYGKNLPTKNLLSQGYAVFGGNGKIGYFDKYLYEEPQVLISCRGEASGKVNISERNSFITNNSLVLERTKNKDITFEYLKYYCLSSNFYTYVSGSAQPQITIEGLYEADFLMPSCDLIQEFSKIVSDFENKIENNQKQIKNLQSMRDLVLSKIFNEKMEV